MKTQSKIRRKKRIKRKKREHSNFIRSSVTASPDNDYGYDDLNRLVTVDYIDETDEEFTYDKLGNRTGTQDLQEGRETHVVNAQKNRYDGVGGNSLTYDDAGNLTTDPNGIEYEYDYENRLVQFDGGLRAHRTNGYKII